MEFFIVMQEGRRGGWVPAKDVDGKSILAFRSADEAWARLWDCARKGGQYRPTKVERVVLQDADVVPVVDEGYQI